MKYYKVKPDANGWQMNNGWQLVANELVTEAEMNKRKWDKEKALKQMDLVKVSQKGTFFCFGARFIKSNYTYIQS